jgi:hypothetical protein
MKIAAIVALAGVAAAANAQIGRAVSFDAADDNYLSETISVAPGYDGNAMLETWGGGDMFGITSRPLAEGTPFGMPFAMADDSLTIFPGDSLGIVGELDLGRFFGVVDSVNGSNPSGDGTAEWSFDIIGASDMSVSVDFAAMGDFEASSDAHLFTYSIDGGITYLDLFTATIDESATQTYTMDDGGMYDIDDPMSMNGVLLNNDFQSVTADIDGTSSLLLIRYYGINDSGSEAFAFRNMTVVPTPATAALMGLGGLVALRRRR